MSERPDTAYMHPSDAIAAWREYAEELEAELARQHQEAVGKFTNLTNKHGEKVVRLQQTNADLLAALREIAEMEDEPVKPDGRTCIEVARAAIAKATQGEADIARQQAVRIQHLEQALREIYDVLVSDAPQRGPTSLRAEAIARAILTAATQGNVPGENGASEAGDRTDSPTSAATQGEVDLEASEVVHATVYKPATQGEET